MKRAALVLSLLVAAGCSPKSDAPGALKLGFLVKQPDEPWFQLEWKFAEQAGKELGFELVKVGVPDGEKVLNAIDSLAVGGARGFVICTPDVRLGPSIVRRAAQHGLKLIAVDDQFMAADGKPMTEVHYLGISARKIGEMVGDALLAESKQRGWALPDAALCAVTYDELDTARDRTDGATARVLAGGLAKERVFKAPQKTTDIPGGFEAMNTLLTQHPEITRWLVCGLNDNAVLGAVRALEGRGRKAAEVIGIGINGTDCIAELEKAEATGFFGSVLLMPRQHGHDTATMLYRWVKDGQEPPRDTRTAGVLIHRGNFRAVLTEQGIR